MKRRIGPIVMLVIWTALAAAAQQVSSTYNRSYDFSKVKIFAVKIDPAWDDSTLEDYTEAVVVEELRAKGWILAANGTTPDVLVVIKGQVEDKRIEESYYDGGIIGPAGAGVSSPAGVTNGRVVEEKLGEGSINIIDTKTNTLIFSGTGAGEVSNEEKKNEQKIKKGIEKIFKDFPLHAKRLD